MVSTGTLDFTLEKCLIFTKGLYKATLELSCKNEELKYNCNVNNIKDLEHGKFMTKEWQQPVGLENAVLFEDQQILVELTKSKEGLLLHTTKIN